MAEFDDSETTEYCNLLMNDEPKIEYVIKNIITILLAVNMTNQATAEERERAERITPSVVIGCGRVLVKTINSFTLMGPLDWGVENPQPDNQSALDRIDDIARYRVTHLLWQRVQAKGGKVCKLFGKTFLVWSRILSLLRKTLTSACSNSKSDIPLETMIEFFDLFEYSISGQKKCDAPSAETKNVNDGASDSCLPENYQELVWTNKFTEKLQERQQERWGKVEVNATWNISDNGISIIEEDPTPVHENNSEPEVPSTSGTLPDSTPVINS